MMSLTQDGFRILANFTICAFAVYDAEGKRISGNDGLMLSCKREDHGDESAWQWHWPGHVAAPSIMHLAVVADDHWREEHAEKNEDATAE